MGCSQSSALAAVGQECVHGDITHGPTQRKPGSAAKRVTFADQAALPRLVRDGDDEHLCDFHSMDSSLVHSSRPSLPSTRLHQKHLGELGKYLRSVDDCPELLELIVEKMREKEFGRVATAAAESNPQRKSAKHRSSGSKARRSRTQSIDGKMRQSRTQSTNREARQSRTQSTDSEMTQSRTQSTDSEARQSSVESSSKSERVVLRL